MPWTNKQKQIAARAAEAAGLDDESRRNVLRQFDGRALFDKKGRAVAEPTSTSIRLNDSDFERFMAVCESFAGGQVLHFSRDYWQEKSRDEGHRLRYRARQMADELEADGRLTLAGFIARQTHDRCDTLEACTPAELAKVIEGMKAIERRSPVTA